MPSTADQTVDVMFSGGSSVRTWTMRRRGTLGKRIVDDRLRRFADRADPAVADETDDLGFGLVNRLDDLADDVLPRKVGFRERLVDNRYPRRAGYVRGIEVASAHDGNRQRLEVSRPDAVRVRPRARDVGAARRMKAARERLASERHQVRHAHQRHARQPRHAFQDAVGQAHALVTGILARVEAELGDHAVVDVEPEIRRCPRRSGFARRAARARSASARGPPDPRRAHAAARAGRSRRRRPAGPR